MAMQISSVTVGCLLLDFRLRQARSLKDKRSIVSRLKERIRSRYNASVAEVDAQDDLRRLVVSCVMVGSDSRQLQSTLDKILNYVETLYLAELVRADTRVEVI